MTALNWYMDEATVVAATDTLVVRADTKEAIAFVTKIFPVPHAHTIIAGTGVADILCNAAFTVSCRSICRDIDDVARTLQDRLTSIPTQMFGGATSTVYAFGWSEDGCRMKGFAFRSTGGFLQEEIPYGIATKPATVVEYPDSLTTDFFIELFKHQKEVEESKPNGFDGRVEIGGEVIAAVLTNTELKLSTIHRFDDYIMAFGQAIANRRD